MRRISRAIVIGLLAALSGCDRPAEPTEELSLDATATDAPKGAIEIAATVDIVEVPEPADDVTAAAGEPLTTARSLARRIDRGAGIERIAYGDGWAWRENGHIIRTASRDGREVAYFRPGEDEPFLVQQGDRALAVKQGEVRRAYSSNGRPTPLTDSSRQTGQRISETSAGARVEARQVAAQQPERVQREQAAPTVSEPRSRETEHADDRGSSRGSDGPARTSPSPRPAPSPPS